MATYIEVKSIESRNSLSQLERTIIKPGAQKEILSNPIEQDRYEPNPNCDEEKPSDNIKNENYSNIELEEEKLIIQCYKKECKCELTHQVPKKRGLSITNLISLFCQGYNFYSNIINSYNTSVFKLNLVGIRVVMCDTKSISYMFQKSLIKKEENFGLNKFQKETLNNYTPLIFQNNPKHDQTKAILYDYLKIIRQELTINELNSRIEKEIYLLSEKTKTVKDFEFITMNCMNSIVTSVLFGSVLHFDSIKLWLSKTFHRKESHHKMTGELKITYDRLIKEIQDSTYFHWLKETDSGHLLTGFGLANEMLMISAFNATGALFNCLQSCIVYLIKLKTNDREKLIEESKLFISRAENESLDNLKYTNCFVLEVLRLHPPAHKIFGVAEKDFMLSSTSRKYYIKKDTMLCGDIYNSQRNAEYFTNPNEFELERFLKDPNLTQHLILFGGDFNNHDIAQHHCLGQHLAILVLKLCVAHLCTYQIEPVKMPIWTGKKYGRLSASDKPLIIKTFKKLN